MAYARTALLLGVAIVVASAGGASAADLGGGLKDVPVAVPVQAPRSWYLRADGGYSFYDTPSITENYCGCEYDLVDTDIANTWSVGGGIGMYFGRGFRGDITVDHRFESDVSGYLADGPLPGTREFGLSSTVALANLYYDFDYFGGRFTPYIGGGVGVSYNTTSSGVAVGDCPCGGGDGIIAGHSQTEFAAAAMAGVSWKLRGGDQVVQGSFKDGPMVVNTGRALFLDVGYRFLYLGDAATGPITFTGGPGPDDPTVESITAHEVRVGLRYNIN